MQITYRMPPNHVIVLILLLVPIFIYLLWISGKHILSVLNHNVLVKKMEDEARREETQAAEEARVAAEVPAPVASQR